MTRATDTARPHLLDFEQLRAALDAAVDLAVARFGPTVDLDEVAGYDDYHWHLPVDVAFAMDDDPGLHVNAGQSSDDLDELAEMVAHPDEQVLSHSLEHLASVLDLVAFLDSPRGPRRRPAGRTSPLPDPVIDPSRR